MSRFESSLTLDLVLLAICGVIASASLAGTLGALLAPAGPAGRSDAFVCIAPFIAGTGCMLMVLSYRRAGIPQKLLVSALSSCFLGANLLALAVMWLIYPGSGPADLTALRVVGLCSFGTLMVGIGFIRYASLYGRRRPPVTATQAKKPAQPAPNPSRADQLRQATQYRDSIANLLKRTRNAHFSDQLASVTSQVDRCISRLREIVTRIDAFEHDRLIQRDIREVPAAITRLAGQLKAERDPQVRAQIDTALDSYRQQQSRLQALAALMRRTTYEIDRALANIGILHSQLHLLEASDIDSQRAEHLQDDMNEQLQRLSDLLQAMDEVYRR